MNEMTKTLVYAGAAVLLLGGAWLTRPSTFGDSTFDDSGEKFFPEFTDPLDAASLEIIDFDQATATMKPFKVARAGGVWSIPSHEGYPADAQRQLGEAAAAIIGLKKLTLASDDPSKHDEYGVVEPDPAKLTAGVTGVGKRVTIADKKGDPLAQFIFGKADPDKPELRYVRVPGQDRVYTAKVPTDKLSTKFEDWIEADLLKLNAFDVKQVTMKDHSVDVLQGAIALRSDSTVDVDKDGKWTLAEMNVFDGPDSKPVQLADDEELDDQKLNDLKNALDDLKIVDVAHKPAGVSADLRGGDEASKISNESKNLLGRRGFYFARLPGRPMELFSNEGEVRCGMNNGVEYLLRFGAIAGRGQDEEDKTTPGDKAKGGDDATKKGDANKGVGENRYILVTTRFNENLIPKPELKPLPGEPAKEAAPANDATAPAKDQTPPAKATTPAKDAPPAKDAAPTKDKAPPAKSNPPAAKQPQKAPAKSADAPNGGGSDGDGNATDSAAPKQTGNGKSGPAVITVSQKSAGNQPKNAAAKNDSAKKADAKKENAKTDAKPGDAKTGAAKAPEAKAAAPAEETKKPDAPPAETGKTDAQQPPAAPAVDIEQERKQIEADNKHAKEDYDAKVKEGQKKVEELNERFANWYYVISDKTYQKIHLGRDTIVKKKTKPTGEGDKPQDFDALKNALPKPGK